MNETAQLAKFTSEMDFDKLPPQAVLMAKQCLLDCLGVARSARRTCPHFARNCFKNVRHRGKHGI